MNYIIEETLLYYSETGILCPIDKENENSIALPGTPNRILSYLLIHKGKALSKEDILKGVWESHGIDGSSNSLKQYLSYLRKIFAAYFPGKEVITTVPKRGYMISDEVNIKEIESDTPKDKQVPGKKTKRKILFTIICISLLISLALFVSYYKIIASGITRISVYERPAIRGCTVNAIRNISSSQFILKETEIINLIIKKENINCEENSSLYIYTDESVFNNIPGLVTLSHCIEDIKNEDICVSFHYSRWQ
ncbi:winged helix-turn-helix domain-containing protein [Escherichia coli]|uniref:winged helix-turn-helix domain-containing protein n=1 Tax=Escherichia coli TaxID=562 RepID=UPI003D36991F